ncbi:hypothetical protein BGX21_005277 [Mortierella sp. AD011]|nr:hypothetical protein BGX21_005277 [Mortierella sp. AD011]
MGDIESVSESNNSSFLETEIDDYEWESSYESELVHAKEYIPWALEHEKVDDVSFASFVQGYEFMDLEDVKSVYEMLISSSVLRADLATKSVREVQSASMKEIAEKAKLLVSDIGDQSETAYRPKSKRKIEDLEHNYHGPRVGEKSHKLAASTLKNVSHFIRSKKFIVVWANSEAHGSKVRRGFGCKPDGVIVSQRSKFNVMGVGFALTRYVVVRTIDLFEVMN